MTEAERDRYRQKLQELRAALVREGGIEIEPGRKDPTAVGADEDEQPLVEMSQTIASAGNRTRAEVLGRIGVALGRLDDAGGEMFGLCVECEEAIGARRLALMPYVELCVECQKAHDGRRGVSRRSLTDFK